MSARAALLGALVVALALALVLGVLSLPASPETEPPGPVEGALPDAVFEVDRPRPTGDLPRALQDADAHALVAAAWEAYRAGEASAAATFASHAAALDEGSASFYDFACFASVDGQLDAAVYWLQRAALEQGIDLAFARRDPDLAPLMVSAYGADLDSFLAAAAAYWQSETAPVVHVAAPWPPSEVAPPTVPAVVWLHPSGEAPRDFVSAHAPIARAEGFLLLGISAPVATSPRTFVWSEDPIANDSHLAGAIIDAEQRFGTVLDPVVLVGLHQGGTVAADLLASGDPRYDAAVVMSPLSVGDDSPLGTGEALHARSAVVWVGSADFPDTLSRATRLAEGLEAADVSVQRVYDDDVREPGLPADFPEQLTGWFRSFASETTE